MLPQGRGKNPRGPPDPRVGLRAGPWIRPHRGQVFDNQAMVDGQRVQGGEALDVRGGGDDRGAAQHLGHPPGQLVGPPQMPGQQADGEMARPRPPPPPPGRVSLPWRNGAMPRTTIPAAMMHTRLSPRAKASAKDLGQADQSSSAGGCPGGGRARAAAPGRPRERRRARTPRGGQGHHPNRRASRSSHGQRCGHRGGSGP